ncbi:MAG: DUF350 domain-containing protein [Flavobacteriales bacterium]|nr:DUF350 domain-containing protein [Flavobacteriales bacterium]|tara:strand:- start:6312 stop:7163 length:852 start_codon:yes stop_codon:yes gene_type:complete
MEHINFNELLNSAIYFVASLILIFIGRVVYKLFHPKLNTRYELLEKDNLAFSFSYVGYFVGLLLAIGSALLGEHVSLEADLMAIAIYGLGAIFLLNISTIINEYVIFNKFKVSKEILEDQNSGTGIIEAANYIATGLIILGASKGADENLMIVVYWAIAQVALILSSFVYNIITPYNIHTEIEKDNIAVGLGYAGSLVGIAVVLSYAVSFSYDSLSETFVTTGILLLIALIALPVTRLITDKVILPGYDLKVELVEQSKPNIGAGLIEAMAYISSALLITWCF